MNTDFRNLIESCLEEGIKDSLKDLGSALVHVGKQHFGEFTTNSSLKRINIETENLDSKHLDMNDKLKIVDTIANNKNSEPDNLRHSAEYINKNADNKHNDILHSIATHKNSDRDVLNEVAKNRNLLPKTTLHIASSNIYGSTSEMLHNNYKHTSHNEHIAEKLTKNNVSSPKVLKNISDDKTLPKQIRGNAIHNSVYRTEFLLHDILHSTDKFKHDESGNELLKRSKNDVFNIPKDAIHDVHKMAIHLAKQY